MQSYDAIIIGAGHNGLVTAAYLARAGKKVLVLERRPVSGGIAATEEALPGFKYSSCAHLASSFSAAIIADLNLREHGLEMIPLDPLLFAPASGERSLIISRDMDRAAAAIGGLSKADESKFPSFCSQLKKFSEFLRALYALPLPDRVSASGSNLPELIKAAWKFSRLGKKDGREFLRILPMSVADLLNEWFETEALKAAIAATGLLGAFVGPRQQGTAFNFLHHQIGASNGALRRAGIVRGGMSRLPQALLGAARRHGAEIRTNASVERVVIKDGAATGVVVGNGEEIHAAVVISNADAKRTYFTLLESTHLDPLFLLQVKNIRSRGTVAKVNLALDRLPPFRNGAGTASAAELGGIIHVGPTLDHLERAADDAKYGRFSKQPFLEITIPSVADPSVAPAGKHVMSVWMQYAPYGLREGDWESRRETLGDTVVNLLEDYAPGFKGSILHRQILTPWDLEQGYGLTGGHMYHAEMALDQIFFMRPLPGWARYGTPIENLYLCGSGTHPGGGITGLPGYFAAKTILKNWPDRR